MYNLFSNLKEYTRNGACLSFSPKNNVSMEKTGGAAHNNLAVQIFSVMNFNEMKELLDNPPVSGDVLAQKYKSLFKYS